MPENVLPMNIHEFGNSSVATVPTLFDLVLKENYGGHSLKRRSYTFCFCWGRNEYKCYHLQDLVIINRFSISKNFT